MKPRYYCPNCFWRGTDADEKDFEGFWETKVSGKACPKCGIEVEPDDGHAGLYRDGER